MFYDSANHSTNIVMNVAWNNTSERHHCVQDPLYNSIEDSCSVDVVLEKDMDMDVELADLRTILQSDTGSKWM